MILIFATPEEARELLGLSTRQTEILRPQTSGPCVHYGPYGCEVPRDDGQCPHLDNPDVLCPVKDACYAMHEVARMRDKCETEQEEQVSSLCGYYDERSEHADNIDPCTHPDACKTGCPYLDDDGIYCPQKDGWSAASKQAEEDLAWAWGDDIPKFVPLAQDPEGRGHDLAADAATGELVYETAAPEFVEPEPDDGALHAYTVPATRKPTNPNAWSDEEIEVIRRAQSAAEAGHLYVDAFPESNRTVAAVSSRWYRLRAAGELIEPEPEEPVFVVPHPTYRPGDRVRIKHALHRGQTGKIERYFPATENYLVAIDGLPDRIILRDKDLEVEA